MRFIFCRRDSDDSRSVEHIVPESLGNRTHVLPRGVVCDGCNNYFARKVEGPLLSSGMFRSLRFHQAIENKRGRVPSARALYVPGSKINPDAVSFADLVESATAEGEIFRDGHSSLRVTPALFEQVVRGKKGGFVFTDGVDAPDDRLVSRFLAKCAVEALAERFLSAGLEYHHAADFAALDPRVAFSLSSCCAAQGHLPGAKGGGGRTRRASLRAPSMRF